MHHCREKSTHQAILAFKSVSTLSSSKYLVQKMEMDILQLETDFMCVCVWGCVCVGCSISCRCHRVQGLQGTMQNNWERHLCATRRWWQSCETLSFHPSSDPQQKRTWKDWMQTKVESCSQILPVLVSVSCFSWSSVCFMFLLFWFPFSPPMLSSVYSTQSGHVSRQLPRSCWSREPELVILENSINNCLVTATDLWSPS